MTTVLLVEPDDATRDLYRRQLSRSFVVLASSDFSEALQWLQEEEVHAVILEPAISDGSGWTLLHLLGTMQFQSPLPVILCSALDERRRGINLGAAAYLVKPVLPMTLVDTLNRVLQGHVERREA